MNSLRLVSRLAITWFAAVAIAAGAPGAQPPVNGPKTPLDEYVAKPDPAYEWKVVKTVPGDGYTTFVVDLKSQTWRAPPDVDRAVWQHWLVVVRPDSIKHSTGFLSIGGGRNGTPAPDDASPQSIAMAKATGSVVAELKMVPNQPLVLNSDGKPRSEDDLLAEGWVKYMDTGDPLWIVRLPMVKSAVRAMDTVTALMASEQGGKADVKTFVVAGGSKRGWTTWLTGAVDKRVVAVVPIVIDVLNVRVCSINHFCAYGFWAPAIGDYTRHKIFERSDTPQYAALMRIEDPYFYRDRLTMPKYVVNAAGDQYFPPDSSKFYFGDLVGPKFLRYVPNADHSLRGSDAHDGILAFYQAVLNKTAMPRFSWEMAADGSIRVKTEDKPREVSLWQATNPKARDFRLEAIGQAYKKSRLDPGEGGVYVAKVPKPDAGWTAFFVELVFDGGGKEPLKFTTQVSIVPDVLPYKIEDAKKSSK
jgi:PhoPQ-activated pathogenicity-related protein